MAAAAAPASVYWIGTNGNAYVKGPSGVTEYTNPTGASANGFSGLLTGSGEGQDVQAKQIADPNPGGASGSGTGNGSGTSSYTNPAAAALYGNLASEYEDAISQLEGEQPQLESNINNAYDTSVSEQNQAAQNEQNQNMQQRQTTNGTIDQNANSTYNALMALLGANGAAGSSAATFGVPQAVGSNTNSATNTMDTTYNENNNTIQESNANALADLLSQKNTSLSNGLSGLATQEASDVQAAQGDEANAAYYGGTPNATLDSTLSKQAPDIQSQLSQIFSQYATPTFTAAAAPGLATYSTPSSPTVTTPSASTPATSSAAFLPYLTQTAQGNNNVLTGSNTTPAPTGGTT